MPWKTKTASRSGRTTSLAEEQRSAFRDFAFCGCGAGGDGRVNDVGEDDGVGWVVEELFCEDLAYEACCACDEDVHFRRSEGHCAILDGSN